MKLKTTSLGQRLPTMDVELEFSDDGEVSVGSMEAEDTQTQPSSSLESAAVDEFLEFDEEGVETCLNAYNILETAVEREGHDSDVDMEEVEDADTE